MESNKISPEEIKEIDNIINSFSWAKNSVYKNELINRFYDLLREVDNDKRWIIFYLSKKIENIDFFMYENYCYELIKEIKYDLNIFDKIFLIPILKESDFNKVKSSHPITYFLQSIFDIHFGHNIKNKTIILNNISSLNEYENTNTRLIILCDSFIGTGTQLSNCIKTYEKLYKKDNDYVLILSIAILEKGLSLIRNLGYQVIYATMHQKGISDDTALNTDEALETMKAIEDKIQIPKNYRFGYKKSEALLAFDLKSPNNTFPIFWYSGPKNRNTIFFR